jgi:hypothetical protein
MNYYFLVASLPALSLDAPPPLSSDRFSGICREHLNREDLAALGDLAGPLAAPSPHPFVREWRNREILLRNAVARQRASRLKRDPAPHLRERREFDPGVERAAAEAFAKPDPLERERSLDRFRWRDLDELAGLNPFSSEAVLAYSVKLRLVEQWSRLNRAEGRQRLEETVNAESKEQEGLSTAGRFGDPTQ